VASLHSITRIAQPASLRRLSSLRFTAVPIASKYCTLEQKPKEKLVWYTSLAGDSYKEMVKAFETKYPGVKVESYRAAEPNGPRLKEEASRAATSPIPSRLPRVAYISAR
jgi:hypothetical protein